MRLAPALLGVVLFALPACTTYRDELARSQRAFEENQHEHALAILRVLEPDTGHLDAKERAHYAYLRGMTDYRIGYKSDARHWLAVAKAMDDANPGLLPGDWRGRLDQSLAELDAAVWASGMESLANARPRPAAAKHAPEPAEEPAAEEEEEESPKSPPPKKKKKPIDEEEE